MSGAAGSRQTVTVRSRTSRALGATMGAGGLFGLVSTAVSGRGLVEYGAAMALFALLGWAAFWRPHVVVSDGGVRIVNTLRTVDVPWPAVEGVEGRYGLRLRTSYGPVTAWGAGAPSGRSRAREVHSDAAREVEERLAELSAAGYLDAPRLERTALPTRWHGALIAVLVLLASAAVVLPLL